MKKALFGLAQREDQAVKIAYPITIRGKLEWGGKTTPFEQSFSR